MHPDIAEFPNTMFYFHEHLRPVPLPHQQQPSLPYALPSDDTLDDVLKQHLSKSFGVAVSFACNKDGKGKISFPFKNEEELERIIRIFDTLKH